MTDLKPHCLLFEVFFCLPGASANNDLLNSDNKFYPRFSKTSNQLKHEHYWFLSNSIKSTSPYIMYVIETIDTFSTETQIYQYSVRALTGYLS
jgi:hypothetical protein